MSMFVIVLAGAIAAGGPVGLPRESNVQVTDVAYGELSAGNAEAAVQKLEQNADRGSDPAVLINLGTAYARQGATNKALVAFRAAAASPERYDLELADGSWRDSRDVARMALANLQRSTAQAAR